MRSAERAGDAVRSAYSDRSAEYIDLFGSIDAADPVDRERVSRWADGLTGPVLDAGCGPGHWTRHLAGRGLAAHGVDQVPEFVQRARREYPGLPFRLGSIDALDEGDASFGGVLAWYSLIHHEPSAVGTPLREFARVLAPGGGLLVGFFTGERVERFDHAVIAAYRWPVDALGGELDAAGFDVLEAHERIEAGQRPQGTLIARRRG
ncbi:class I SAM-dependent methyltransferase [Leifsonia sp. NPDC080035]|uniref:Class I SAM-dependent methyltransferase n=1 Tax=Leifsonia sp. NPDC080035 TaxID=3143936 RepID=A0AAU7GF11_9MICO